HVIRLKLQGNVVQPWIFPASIVDELVMMNEIEAAAVKLVRQTHAIPPSQVDSGKPFKQTFGNPCSERMSHERRFRENLARSLLARCCGLEPRRRKRVPLRSAQAMAMAWEASRQLVRLAM